MTPVKRQLAGGLAISDQSRTPGAQQSADSAQSTARSRRSAAPRFCRWADPVGRAQVFILIGAQFSSGFGRAACRDAHVAASTPAYRTVSAAPEAVSVPPALSALPFLRILQAV